ncbi:PDZ domain-containing protein [Metabacillus sp. 84]|uniref:PDZ domain-containing protein n=1 Tax=unclassified Metabacillus TaxID=2675274 RepID=UPI003CF12685
MDWTIELLKGAGRFFLHPLVYYIVLYSLFLGTLRVKRERAAFHTKVEDIYDDLKFTFTKGLFIGLMVSAVIILTGLSLPFGLLIAAGIAAAGLSLFFKVQLLSAAFTMGIAFAAAVILPSFPTDAILRFFEGIEETNLSALTILTGILLLAEGLLVYRSGHIRTSPAIMVSSRGLPIGRHIANRTWMLPVIFFVPGGALTSVFSWWPVFEMNGQSFSLIIAPFLIGFRQSVRGSLPKESIQVSAKRIIWLGLLTLVIACASVWWQPLAFVSILCAVAGRSFLIIRQKMNDDSASFFFSKKDRGLMILGILPGSPADKIGLKVGETIIKVNGTPVKNTGEFYEALQKNRALCKLEMIGLNGEIRYEQRATYEGDHHELGLLFVEQPRIKSLDAV